VTSQLVVGPLQGYRWWCVEPEGGQPVLRSFYYATPWPAEGPQASCEAPSRAWSRGFATSFLGAVSVTSSLPGGVNVAFTAWADSSALPPSNGRPGLHVASRSRADRFSARCCSGGGAFSTRLGTARSMRDPGNSSSPRRCCADARAGS